MTDPQGYLAAYDQELRTDAETPSAIEVTLLGSIRLVKFAGGRGFVTYGPLPEAEAAAAAGLVPRVLDHFRRDPTVERVEWKARDHDRIPGLHRALVEASFVAEETESIMIGPAEALDIEIELPKGVTLRRITGEDDVRAMAEMEDRVFGSTSADETVRALLYRLGLDDGTELWVAEAGGEVIGAGRLEPVAGTRFAGIWGGAVLEQWRGRGIYRALTATRARSAVAAGKTLIHSDSTEYSRPILERAGLTRVSSTTPYLWHRPADTSPRGR